MATYPRSAQHYPCDPLASGCRSLRAGPLPSAWHERSSAQKGKAAAHLAAHVGEKNNALATLTRTGLVWGKRSCDRDLEPYSSLVSHRIAGRAHPLGTHPGPARALRSTSPAVYRSSAEPTHDREL